MTPKVSINQANIRRPEKKDGRQYMSTTSSNAIIRTHVTSQDSARQELLVTSDFESKATDFSTNAIQVRTYFPSTGAYALR